MDNVKASASKIGSDLGQLDRMTTKYNQLSFKSLVCIFQVLYGYCLKNDRQLRGMQTYLMVI